MALASLHRVCKAAMLAKVFCDLCVVREAQRCGVRAPRAGARYWVWVWHWGWWPELDHVGSHSLVSLSREHPQGCSLQKVDLKVFITRMTMF